MVDSTALTQAKCRKAVIATHPCAKRISWRDARAWGFARRPARSSLQGGAWEPPDMRVALDGRPASDPDGVGRYSRCLLAALRDTVAPGDEIVQTQRPSTMARSFAADVFHAPWMNGAMLHS